MPREGTKNRSYEQDWGSLVGSQHGFGGSKHFGLLLLHLSSKVMGVEGSTGLTCEEAGQLS